MGTVPEADSVSLWPLDMPLEDSTMQQGDDSGDVSRQLHYLETILGELKSDLSKERRDKLLLLAEVECLRKNNHHLLEESLFAYEELHKLKSTFSVAPGDVQ
ncbi:signal-induced proliferation-associated 1-like protein 3 [Sardina pilchardus]|uniref:signal-induced proliferation-associated 1-like protein 3 n=1 Tax=Sardina pilchardus TaxID=27697 RepID=UPI002E1411D3